MLTDLIPFPAETLDLEKAGPEARQEAAPRVRQLLQLDQGRQGHDVEEVFPAHQPASG